MKSFAIFATAALVAVPAVAQDHANHANHAASAAPAPAAAPAAAAKFSLDTPIETLMADAKAKAVVEANVPGIGTHEHYEMFKSMSFNQLAPMAGDKLTPAVLAKLNTELAAVK